MTVSSGVSVWTANINGDDVPHIPVRPDIVGIQEMQGEQCLRQVRHWLPDGLRLVTPPNGQYQLGVVLDPKVFKVDSVKMHRAHPSGQDMAKDRDWDMHGKRYPQDQVPTPPRGVLELLGEWADGRKGYILNGHAINRGPGQPVRDVLMGAFVATFRDILNDLKRDDRVGVTTWDFNDQHPPRMPHHQWVAGHGPDHIGMSDRGFRVVGHQVTGGVAGHSGRVHHKSLGIILQPVR